MGWWILLIVFAFLHPILLANVVNIFAQFVLSEKVSFSVRRVSIFTFTVGGLALNLNQLPFKTVHIGSIRLLIQFRKVFVSWFEERPFKLLINDVEILFLKSVQVQKRQSPVGLKAPSDTKGVVASILGNNKQLNHMIIGSRLLALEVINFTGQVEEKDSFFCPSVVIQSMRCCALHLPSSATSCGSLTALVKLNGVDANACSPSRGTTPCFNMSSFEMDVEFNVVDMTVSDVCVRFGEMTGSSGLKALSMLTSTPDISANDKEQDMSSDEMSSNTPVPPCLLPMGDVPRKVRVVISRLSFRVIDDIEGESVDGVKFGATDIALTADSAVSTTCRTETTMSADSVFCDYQDKVRLLEMLNGSADTCVTLNATEVKCGPLTNNWKKLCVLMTPAAAEMVARAHSLSKSAQKPPSADVSTLPGMWPNQVLMSVGEARAELRNLHPAFSHPPRSSTPIQNSSYVVLASSVLVRLDAEVPLRAQYRLTVSTPVVTARAVIFSAQSRQPQEADSTEVETRALEAKQRAVVSGRNARAFQHIDLRLAMAKVVASGVVDGRLKERLDEVSSGEVVVSDGAVEVVRLPSMRILSTAPSSLDLRVSPWIEVAQEALFNWSPAIAQRAITVALIADSSLTRALRAMFPPKVGRKPPTAEPLVVRFCGCEVALHGDSYYGMSLKLMEAEMSLTTSKKVDDDDHKFTVMAMSARAVALSAVVRGQVLSPSVLSITGMRVTRSLDTFRGEMSEDWAVELGSLTMSLPRELQAGDLLEVFLSQDAGVAAAAAAAKGGLTSLTRNYKDCLKGSESFFAEDGSPYHTATVNQKLGSMKSMTLNCAAFEVQIWKDDDPILNLMCQNLNINSDVIREPAVLARELRRLDQHGADITYNNAMGSRLVVDMVHFKSLVHGKTQFLSAAELSLSFAPVILASLDSIPHRTVSHTVTLFRPRHGNAVEFVDTTKNPSWLLLPESQDPWEVTTVRDGMPLKVYLDFTAHLNNLDVSFAPDITTALSALGPELARLSPTQKDNETMTTPLPWWDNMRYQLHGPIRLLATNFTLNVEVTEPPVPTSPLSPRLARNRSGSMAPAPLRPYNPPSIRLHCTSCTVVAATASVDALSLDSTSVLDMSQEGMKTGELRDMRAFIFEMLTISCPATPPHRWHDPTANQAEHQVLCLFPRWHGTATLNWRTSGSFLNHHVQLLEIPSSDSFEHFRSIGLDLSMEMSLLGQASSGLEGDTMELEAYVGCWAACPLELLAWFRPQPPPTEREDKSSSPSGQVLSLALRVRNSPVFLTCWPSAVDTNGLTLELMHSELEQKKSRREYKNKLKPLTCDLLNLNMVSVRMHLSEMVELERLVLADSEERSSKLLAALVTQRHAVRAQVDGGRRLALQAKAIVVKQSPLNSENEEPPQDNRPGLSKPTAGVSAIQTIASLFSFGENHAILKPPPSSLPLERVFHHETRRRRSSMSSVGSRRNSINDGYGRRGSLIGRRESFDVFASSLLSPSPRSAGIQPDVFGVMSPTEKAIETEGIDEDEIVKTKFDTDEDESSDDGHSFLFSESEFSDDEEEEGEDDHLRTELEVDELRFVYTIPIRDRFTHFSIIWVRLFGDNEIASHSASKDNALLHEEEGGKVQGDRLTDIFLRRRSNSMDERRRSSGVPSRPLKHGNSRLDNLNRTMSGDSWKEDNGPAQNEAAAVASAAATFESTLRYRVKFINPQVNILCARSKGALVLGVAEASLVGRDLGVFYKQSLQDGGRIILTKHERLVAVSGALAFTARMDVDVNRGVCWLSDVQNPKKDNILKQVISPFDMRIRAEEFSRLSSSEWNTACVEMTAAVRRLHLCTEEGATFEPPLCEVRSLADRLRADLPDLDLTLDRDDFITLSDVVRNVLLAPPFESNLDESASDTNNEFHVVAGHIGQWDSGSKESRYALKAVVEQELVLLSQERSANPPRKVRCVEYKLGKGTWSLKSNMGDTQEVQIGFSGFSGSHQFLSDETIESVLTLESMWLFNHKPGALSLTLPDPMVILKPLRCSEPHCLHCFNYFTPEYNRRTSCGCHANMWGEEGYFLSRGGTPGEWTCCGATSLRAPHCSSKQHASHSLMFNVRAITAKPMLVGDTPVQVFSELQISLFPSSKQTVEIQLTSDIANFINSYFFEVQDTTTASPTQESSSALFGARISGVKELTRDSSDEEDDPVPGPSAASTRSNNSNYDSATPIVYLKYCRIGEVDLEISTVGFGKKWGVALDREKISLNSPAFHRSQRIVTWGQMGAKYCKHVGTNLVSGRKKVVAVVPTSCAEETMIDSPKNRIGSLGSVSAVQKGVMGAASSMLKAKNQAKAVASSALGRKPSSKSTDGKDAREMLFGAKR